MNVDVQSMPDAASGLELEARLLTASGSQIALWTAQRASLVCPKAYARRDGFEAATQRSTTRNWPVFQRPTGGGTVPQGPGVDNIALAFNAPKGATIEGVYRLLTRVIQRGLGPQGASLEPGATAGSFCDGAWNLSVAGRKIVGTAQRWRAPAGGTRRVLAHALILTRDSYAEGAGAVARFHEDLGLDPVAPEAHTSLEAAFGLSALPAAALHQTARDALAAFQSHPD